MTQVSQKDAANLVCVMLDVHIWSGRRHLKKEDLLKANPAFSKIPEKDLVNLGSVKIYDHQDLKKFNSVKGKAERVLARAGLPILGAFGIPEDKFAMVHAKLAEFQKEFDEYAAKLIGAYDEKVALWKVKQQAENPDYAHLLADVPTATHVAGRISFAFHPYRISAPASQESPELNAQYDKQVKGLKGELMDQVAEEANTLITDYLMGKDESSGVVKRRDYITPKTLGPLKRASEKLRTFSFLDPTIEPLANHIDSLVKSLPVEGRISGDDLIKVWSLAQMLSVPAAAARIAAQAHEGKADAMAGLVMVSQDKQEAAAPTKAPYIQLDLGAGAGEPAAMPVQAPVFPAGQMKSPQGVSDLSSIL